MLYTGKKSTRYEMTFETGSGTTEYARAKLNLSLDVLGKRDDGFHELRMVMQSALLCDDVYVELSSEPTSARSNRPYIPCDERNSAVKAAAAFFAAAGIEGVGARITIQKRLPVCAGLGGGSSDAAAVLRALNRLTGAGIDADALRAVAAAVGSDVPFCVEGGTALAEGRGELLTELTPLPETPTVICMPSFTASTPELFGRIDSRTSRCRPDTAGLIRAIDGGNAAEAAHRLYNVFEDVLGRRSADVREIKNALLDRGAMGAAMSGTGSAIFALFPDVDSAEAAGAALAELCRETFVTSTCGKTPL